MTPRNATTVESADRLDISGSLNAEDAALIGAARAFASDAVTATATPGLSVALARGGRLIWREGFGFADIAREVPMSIDTTWPVGSFSKTYVAIAVMQLVEDGVLELSAPISRYIPDIDVANPLGERDVTLYDLLTYRSGLALDTGGFSFEPVELRAHLQRAYHSKTRPEYQHAGPLWSAKVGARYQYSSLGVATAGYVVERMNPNGLAFADYVRARITRPLGLVSTGFPPFPARDAEFGRLAARRCTGYARMGAVLIPSPIVHAGASPAVSLVTTPADHALLLQAMIQGGQLDGTRILASDTTTLMLKPHVEIAELAPESGWWNGIGFEMTNLGRSDFNVGHGGAQVWGWCSLCAAFPEHDLAVVACSNRWDLPRYYNPPSEIAPGLIVAFIADWLRGDAAARARRREERPWAWRASYAIGFTLVERTVGLLGINERLPATSLRSLEADAAVLGASSAEVWDPAGFRAGARDAQGLAMTPAAIAGFLEDGRAPISAVDLQLLAIWFGHKRRLALPIPFFAG
jgi:CubicO group peptidase (beta-lactamase class C family)